MPYFNSDREIIMNKKKLISLTLGCALGGSVLAQDRLPPTYDPTSTCDVNQSQLNTWFTSGAVSKNGMVNAANGDTFPPIQNTACDFYKWGAQMFLWLTSPLADTPVFDGPMFYDVVLNEDQPNSPFILKFESNSGANINNFALRTRKSSEADSVGQAGGDGVLLAQDDTLVFYGVHANDVYANYRTAQQKGDLSGVLATNFPVTLAQVQTVERAVGKTFNDATALSLELKTSWVASSAVVNKDKHVLANGTVPTYTKNAANTLWTQSGTETRELALVGIHVVGTVNGHPEMVWATFEHVDNAPDAAYNFEITLPTLPPTSIVKNVPYDSSGSWTFIQSGAANTGAIPEFATANTKTTPNTIAASSGQTITANNVVRLNPWGSPPANGQETVASMQNSAQLISLNRDIMTKLEQVGDVRANYFQSGSIWSSNGDIPSSDTDPILRGSLYSANATMETFHQFPDENSGFVSRNCFTCHSSKVNEGITTSHIFSKIAPLAMP